ncbi:S-protein homolog 2-like [Papaver somniferum]|uniref:S-protein homolog 2-like n=1 Tax=Papaver somniferum TaxID=3469 RepID=UPI000E700D23|nr:S-protein homolog 2-like [Papaver somniferum]
MGTLSSHGSVSLLLLLLFSVLVSKGSSVTVYVQNDIEGYKVSLDMHCRSKDDDLGQRWLNQGQEWHWKSGVIDGFTHYWCDFRWYDNRDNFWYKGTFDVYHADFFMNKYREYCDDACKWSARRDGFYLFRVDRDEWQKQDEWHVE